MIIHDPKVWEDYKQWLLEKVGFGMNSTYSALMDQLHNTSFFWEIPRDRNRAGDGLRLRDDFSDEYCRGDEEMKTFSDDPIVGECEVLEMLVGLASRMDLEYTGEPGEPDPSINFKKMLTNLGLLKYRNNRYNPKKVDDILWVWMARRFKKDGEGSIFPMRETKRDQRNIEIWSQMNEYISENYQF